MNTIEMVCTGNRGRSPPAALIANNHLARRGMEGKYIATSSGTSVDDIKQGNVSTAFMIRTVQMARDRGDVYDPKQLKAIDDAIGSANENVIEQLYKVAVHKFGEEEERYRAEVLPDLGITGEVKQVQEQTIAGPDRIAVLSMAGRNNNQVVTIYENAGYSLAAEQPPVGQRLQKNGHTPLIAVLSAYATSESDAEVPNAFGKDKAAYRAAIEALVDHVPKAIERTLEDLST